MKNMIKMTDYCKNDIFEIFNLTDELKQGKHRTILSGKSIIMFFPNTSIRTRVTFEKGIYLLGGQAILFPSEALDKKEAIKDVCGYLNNWADMIIVRHKDIEVINQLSVYAKIPVINAMTDIDHPCEIIADMYALSKIRKNFINDKYLFCGYNGNIGLAWKEASKVMGFELMQCCPKGYEMNDVIISNNLLEAIKEKDIVCVDSLPKTYLKDFRDFQITKEIMALANNGAILNPCPPFYRGEEVSQAVIDSKYFVGYEFKKHLLEVQQAIIIYCLTQ